MIRPGRALVGWGLLTVAGTSPLAAQYKGLPVYGDAATPGPWAVWLDAGSGVNDRSGRSHFIGGRLSASVGALTLGVGGGLWDTAAGASGQVGGTAGLRLLGGPDRAITAGLLAGVGYAHSGADSMATTYVTAPLALAVRFNRVRVAGHAIVPWVAPRGELDQVKFPGARGDQGGLGVSAGLHTPLAGRIGLYGAVDWLQLFRRGAGGVTFLGGSRLTAGVGARVLLGRAER